MPVRATSLQLQCAQFHKWARPWLEEAVCAGHAARGAPPAQGVGGDGPREAIEPRRLPHKKC
eukprot:9358048-Pyramimonas_sp.AAC.1